MVFINIVIEKTYPSTTPQLLGDELDIFYLKYILASNKTNAMQYLTHFLVASKIANIKFRELSNIILKPY